jgi:hypothetical protein
MVLVGQVITSCLRFSSGSAAISSTGDCYEKNGLCTTGLKCIFSSLV